MQGIVDVEEKGQAQFLQPTQPSIQSEQGVKRLRITAGHCHTCSDEVNLLKPTVT